MSLTATHLSKTVTVAWIMFVNEDVKSLITGGPLICTDVRDALTLQCESLILTMLPK